MIDPKLSYKIDDAFSIAFLEFDSEAMTNMNQSEEFKIIAKQFFLAGAEFGANLVNEMHKSVIDKILK